jgi:1,4-alpha-glucan branching enzyme
MSGTPPPGAAITAIPAPALKLATPAPALDTQLAWALADGMLDDAFAVLGPHASADGRFVRVFLPGALAVAAIAASGDGAVALPAQQPEGLFAGMLPFAGPYRLRITWTGQVQETEDPYAFGLVLGDVDLHLIGEGRHFQLAEALGANLASMDGVAGVRFAVWAPNARRVSVVGPFNIWDGRRHPMRRRGDTGIWEIFIPRLEEGTAYQYELVARDGTRLPLKADPVARAAELAPGRASLVPRARDHRWRDAAWMAGRGERQSAQSPISIYELHAASWVRPDGDPDGTLDWAALASRLVPYAAAMGFTHVELMPIAEHPFSGSWGYQPLGLFAPSSRFGDPADFALFVDACHRAGLGVILDWVPAHFPTDAHGMARFDGTALYEHEDPREGFHQDWNTLIYNLGRREVSGFLLASALHWLEHFHIDGLRVDAVASMLYRDYSRAGDAWVPNRFGGRENLESVAFLRELNEVVAERCPGAMVIAEESTAWPGVTAPVDQGGLGFSFKWNMGWMHDSLHYIQRDPLYRAHHHDEMTFSLAYAFSERFALPLSHDEVVHGKGSLLGKMPGDTWQKHANLRAYFGFMWAHPGKKLLFMGGELAQPTEWNHDGEIPWNLLGEPAHHGTQRLVADLNRAYVAHPALHRLDCAPEGFAWLVGDDRANSVFAFLRSAPDAAPVLAVANLTPVPRASYRVGVPQAGRWRELLNTDAAAYGGAGGGNQGGVASQPVPAHGHVQSVELSLPPLATLLLIHEGPAA